MTLLLKSVLLAPLVVCGHLTAVEADAVAARLPDGTIVPVVPSALAALITDAIESLEGRAHG